MIAANFFMSKIYINLEVDSFEGGYRHTSQPVPYTCLTGDLLPDADTREVFHTM